jgi:hypothetical protein
MPLYHGFAAFLTVDKYKNRRQKIISLAQE